MKKIINSDLESGDIFVIKANQSRYRWVTEDLVCLVLDKQKYRLYGFEYKIITPDLSVKYFIFDINDTGIFKIN
jgi:hypothetical protein